MKNVSVVMPICILDEELKQLTRDALFSIKDQYDELIIIDDSSPIKTSEFMSQANTHIMNWENEGYIKSTNKGIRAAKNDYIAIVCNDTRVMSGSLRDMCSDGYAFPIIEGKIKPFWDGAFYVFPKAIGGLYDERFHTYFGDLDKFYTAKKNKIPLYTTETLVWHKQSATSEKLGIRNSQYAKDHHTFMKKWGFDPLDDYYNLIGKEAETNLHYMI